VKKVVIIILILAVIGGGVYFYLHSKKSTPKKAEEKVSKDWNPYATDKNFMVTLTDRMNAVAGGAHIAKFTVTIKFKDEHTYEKFMGYEKPLTEKEKAKEEESHSSSEEGHVTPMNVKINSLINQFMVSLGNEEAKDVKAIEKNMKNYLNENLGLEKDTIDAVLLEQYIFS